MLATRQAAVESLRETMTTNRQIALLTNILSAERDVAVQYAAYGARRVDDETQLKAAYLSTDRQLAAVRSQSSWPSPRPGDPRHLASVDAFSGALRVVRNRTLMNARSPEVNVTLASLFLFYIDVNEFLLVSVAKTNQVNCLRHSSLSLACIK